MVNYKNGKIYKIEPITEHEENEIYVGSTTKQYLSQRMEKHRSCYKSWLHGKCNKVTVYDLFTNYGVENCEIILIESVNAKTKDELLAREKHFIRSVKCVNKNIPLRTEKEYRDDNKEQLIVKRKLFYESNKKEILEKCKDYRSNHKVRISKRDRIYRENNKEALKQQNKLYRAKNNDKIKAHKTKIEFCEKCNCNYAHNHKARHERTKKHIQNKMICDKILQLDTKHKHFKKQNEQIHNAIINSKTLVDFLTHFN